MKIKNIILIFGFILFFYLAKAQNFSAQPQKNAKPDKPKTESKTEWKDKFYKGGNVYFWGTSNLFIGDVSPYLGYRFTPQMSAGLGGSYRYYWNRYSQPTTTHWFGGRLFGRYQLNANSLLQVDYEQWFLKNDRIFQHNDALLAGFGYSFQLGQKSNICAILYYNLLYDAKNPFPYPEPLVYRLCFNF